MDIKDAKYNTQASTGQVGAKLSWLRTWYFVLNLTSPLTFICKGKHGVGHQVTCRFCSAVFEKFRSHLFFSFCHQNYDTDNKEKQPNSLVQGNALGKESQLSCRSWALMAEGKMCSCLIRSAPFIGLWLPQGLAHGDHGRTTIKTFKISLAFQDL